MPAYDAELFSPPAPFARLGLRNLHTGVLLHDVPMLIDCGSDITLVPQAYAARLGETLEMDKGYELAAFDGTKSIAPCVHLDLLFLKRAFQGRYVLIAQAWGILGRDVLNHLALLLDGPNRTWTEFSH